MDYISTKQLAQQWGVSASRVAYLAKQNRIPGAKLVGKSWLFPSDCEKPHDGRVKGGGQVEEDRPFKFPLYHFCGYSQYQVENEFTQEERSLYRAQERHLAADYGKAYDQFRTILAATDDLVIQVGCLYYLCMDCIMLRKFSEFISLFLRYKELVSGDIPFKRELELTFFDLETYCIGNGFFMERFKVDARYVYHSSARRYVTALSAYSAMLKKLTLNAPVDTSAYEIICQECEESATALFLTHLHIYLSALTVDDHESCQYHIGRALSLAGKHGYVQLIAYFYKYAPDMIDYFLDMPEYADCTSIREYCAAFYENINDLMALMGANPLVTSLKSKDYTYLYYAHQGMTNKEIAKAMGLSVSTVSKRFSSIFQRTSTTNKKQLLELIEASFFQY